MFSQVKRDPQMEKGLSAPGAYRASPEDFFGKMMGVRFCLASKLLNLGKCYNICNGATPAGKPRVVEGDRQLSQGAGVERL